MTPKPISLVKGQAMNVVIVTMDSHLASAAERANATLVRTLPGLRLTVHAAAEWGDNTEALARCRADIARAHIVIASMLFLEDHFLPILADLQARREHCDAMVCAMSAAEVTKLTRMGKFDMSAPATGAMAFLKRLRGKPPGKADGNKGTAGAQQMKTLRMLPKILRFIPGTAQDVRAYFLTLQYWLAGSQDNIANMVRLLVERYAAGPRKSLRAEAQPQQPIEYPEVGLYHPRMSHPSAVGLMSTLPEALPKVATTGTRGTVGLLLMRSYLLAGNADHYNGVITALEARGLRVIPAYATGLDQRPAIAKYFQSKDGRTLVDALVSLTGFSLVGGPAYNDAKAAEEVLAALDVPYLAVHPVEFQTLDQWGGSSRGLLPVESTIMVAIPELDGATGAMVFGGRANAAHIACTGCSHGCRFENEVDAHDMHSCIERADALAARVGKLVDLRRSERAERRVAAVIFNFPPNAGATGTAAFLSVFESLFNTLAAMAREGYTVDMPASVDALRESIITGNAARFGAMANVHHRIPANEHLRREKHLKEIEAQWGPSPGKQQSDGSHIFVLGERFGNVFVGIQPAFGYEGDPMRLLFEQGFAPTHAFSAFYRWLREDFAAHAVLHFGTHGALEFMPGKQAGMSARCWPDRLIGDLPNLYLYAANNPSEGSIAKRRAAATLISYMTPPVTEAGLYKGLVELREMLERYRSLEPEAQAEREALVPMIQTQAATLDLAAAEPAWGAADEARITRLNDAVLELEYTLIPYGLHVVGQAPSQAERVDLLMSSAEASHGFKPERAVIEALVANGMPTGDDDLEDLALLQQLCDMDRLMAEDREIDGILRALDGRFLRPAPGGDLLRTPAILPTGRNLHGFDPFRIPSAYAVKDGFAQAGRLLDKHMAAGNPLPESIAMVLWGTDNLKSEGGPIAQALALMGARPRFDSYGRLAGAELIALAELGRPRIDVVITLSGIFRDLLPLQIKLLAEAAFLAAQADEPAEQNFIRKHALAYLAEHGGDLETAALRVFGNAEGAYGANINSLIDNSRWEDGDELAETYSRRKGFAYGRGGRPVQQAELLQSVLADVQLAYQNLDSVELGVTTVDTYFDTLGGVSRAIKRAKVRRDGDGAQMAPVYIGDQTRDRFGGGTVRTLSEQVALETRTRMLNPKWFDAMLKHGYEGVRQIEVHVTNTMGWSATTGQVAPWVYEQLSATFMLDPAMRERLAQLNPTASARVANRLLEAYERDYWQPDAATLEALRQAGDELEDRLEGVIPTKEKAAA
ncbi:MULTISPECIES: magnesium chelatase subunit H [unclassified Roseateles]|uniref:magnesium chelatase subunit H n=1 Tax=unclassified Roseateles TaxID=2626991 RepID=UPI0006FC3263|nr:MULTISPECIES: magnesium chelatase subunit H [unclassified Roseateles]KQW42030.1 magnesium chelatase [Pelomonas sp. Root405]KRA67633.1 magnesium chelatase [Pelomonas sp. Root662]